MYNPRKSGVFLFFKQTEYRGVFLCLGLITQMGRAGIIPVFARIKELCEESKVAIRNVRRDGNKTTEQSEKNKIFSEDVRDSTKEEIQKLTKKYEDEANELAKGREKDVMEG